MIHKALAKHLQAPTLRGQQDVPEQHTRNWGLPLFEFSNASPIII